MSFTMNEKMSQPVISVIMSVYNEPVTWIGQAIDSILNQKFRNFEFIIINDNPLGEQQKDILNKFAAKDNRINIIENTENKGLTKSLNIGISKAKGKYIARMDADDISMPNRFQVQYEYMESHPEVDICGSWAKLIGNISLLSKRIIKLPIDSEQIKLYALFYNPMNHPSMIIRKSSFESNIYNESFIKAQDYIMIGESIINGKKCANIPQTLIKYRVTTKSINKEYVNMQYSTSNYIRREMLLNEFNNVNDNYIKLHNDIMTLQPCQLKLAEHWLLSINSLLSVKYESYKEYINYLTEFAWSNICISNHTSYKYFTKSPLYSKFNLDIFIRFMKRSII